MLQVLVLHVRGLVLHVALVLVEVHHRREGLGVVLVEVFALAPLLHEGLGVASIHVLELDLVIHCHGMYFLELGELNYDHIKEGELVMDLHHKKSSLKIADLYGDLSGAILKKPMRKTGIERSCCGALPFVC